MRVQGGAVSGLAPDVHIFTRSKLPWVRLPEGVRAVSVYYDKGGALAGGQLGKAPGDPAARGLKSAAARS